MLMGRDSRRVNSRFSAFRAAQANGIFQRVGHRPGMTHRTDIPIASLEVMIVVGSDAAIETTLFSFATLGRSTSPITGQITG
jgi:hypothetical protein